MAEPDPRLVQIAVDALRGLQSLARTEGWDWDDNEIIAKTILECFEIRDEFRCMYHDDLSQPRTVPDDPITGRIFTSADELAEAMKGTHGSWREMQHRWVAETDWTPVTAHLDWEYDR